MTSRSDIRKMFQAEIADIASYVSLRFFRLLFQILHQCWSKSSQQHLRLQASTDKVPMVSSFKLHALARLNLLHVGRVVANVIVIPFILVASAPIADHQY